MSYTRIRGGGCFGDDARRKQLGSDPGTFDLQACADAVHADPGCSPFFEFDVDNSDGTPGHGWCGCGGVGGNQCAGADQPGATNTIYKVVVGPAAADGSWGAAVLLVMLIGGLLYIGVGAAYAHKIQGKSPQRDGVVALFPHAAHWKHFWGLVVDGATWSAAVASKHLRGVRRDGFEAVGDASVPTGPAQNQDAAAAVEDDSDDSIAD